MGIETAIIAGVGGSILRSNAQKSAAKSASRTAQNVSDQETALHRGIYQTQRQDLAPFRQDELNRRNAIGELFGFDPVGVAQPRPANDRVPGMGAVSNRNALANYFANNSMFGGAFNPSNLSRAEFADGPAGLASPGGVPTNAIADMAPTGAPPSHQNAMMSKLPVQDQPNPAAMGAANDAATPDGRPALFDSSLPGADRINNSLFADVAQAGYNRQMDRIDASLGDEVFNGGRLNAAARAAVDNKGNALNAYLSTLMNVPPTPATNAGVNAAGAYGANVGNSLGNMGNAMMQSAYQRGNANASMWGDIGSAVGFGLGSFSKPGKSAFSIG